MVKTKRKLDLFGQRDFTLALLQLGLDAESGPLPYLNNAKLTKPYFVAERKNGVVGMFIDAAQVEWQKEEIFKNIESDKRFIPELLEQSRKLYSKIESTLESGNALSHTALQQFIRDTSAVWRWWAGWWWAVEVLEQKNAYSEIRDEIMLLRKRTEKFAPAADHVIRATLKAMYPELGEYVEVISLKEVLENTIPTRQELEKRFKGYVTIDDKVYVGSNIDTAKENAGIELVIPSIEDYKKGILEGTTAYEGAYTGKVSIVLTKKDANNFKEGDVLVASTTVPDFIHAIKKAGAIVTDEGGIVSHAAITARELKKPCIIGTKIATQVLKDGDLVEVDTEKGVVRIIEKASLSRD